MKNLAPQILLSLSLLFTSLTQSAFANEVSFNTHKGYFTQAQFQTKDLEDYSTYKNIKTGFNQSSSSLGTIIAFHKRYGTAPFVIIDKNRKALMSFDSRGHLIETVFVQIPASDELEKGGAGIYAYYSFDENNHYLMAESNRQISKVYSANIKFNTGTTVYILPTEQQKHKFRIKNKRIIFNAAKTFKNRPANNYSPTSKDAEEVSITEKSGTDFTKTFLQTLQQEKSQLMRLLKIDNDDYNMLVEFSYGVMSPETNFGKNWKYKIKEMAPYIVSVAKGNGLNTDRNSRGPTQIKRIPDVIIETYGIDKSDLKDAKAAAITTLAFNADLLRDLRANAHKHPKITEENIQDYLYYFYQGKRWEIRDGTGVPSSNISIMKIKKAIQGLTIQHQ